ncbi:MAG TPA: GreA/GreB family elongation factor [Thermoanaerobaculia bacterium]|nr:GreA/GreB family elongation factor [Thermoanaerobaculia bacterium]
MASASLDIPTDVALLIEQKNFDALEDVWMTRMEAEPENLPFFFGVAAAVKKKGGVANAVSWLRFLADYEAEKGDTDRQIAVLLEIARMSPTDPGIRGEIDAALRKIHAGHPALSTVFAQFPLATAADLSETAGKIARWLRFSPGGIYRMPGRGAGRIAELNPALDVIRMEFSDAKLPLSLVNAEKNLTSLPPEHLLRRKLEDPQGTRALAEREPAETVRLLLESFGRPMTLIEVKENLAGIVEESRWGSFWTAARKNPQIVSSGTGKAAMVSWSGSAGEAEESVHREFEAAPPAQKIEIARKQAKRSKELAKFFAESLSKESRAAADRGEPSLAWELSQAAVKLLPSQEEAFGAAELLSSRDLPFVIGHIRDYAAREKALEAVRAARPDWLDIFAERVAHEDDARVLSTLFAGLAESPERAEDMSRRILRSPRQAPRAFLWLTERLREQGKPLPSNTFVAILDALRQEEFSSYRAKLKEFFDPGSIAVSIVQAAGSEEEARTYLDALERAGGLEEHRRALVKEALLMRFPGLRAPAREYVYSTPEAIEARRGELMNLKQVELPANAEAMRVAKDHGDLSENFEYHAARQRHEYLSARIATLADELSRTRALDPARIDTSEVRVGARVRLRDIGSGQERSATILGPWDSKPEEAVYSYQSEFADALLGAKLGDRVQAGGAEFEVLSIEAWK